jgi:hypothetical protein
MLRQPLIILENLKENFHLPMFFILPDIFDTSRPIFWEFINSYV